MILSETTPDQLPPELAPFVAQARARLEQATAELDPDATIDHLKATVERAAVEASRLGLSFPPADERSLGETLATSDGDGPIVVIQRLSGSDSASD
ncbi:MAG TPA: hypothetical protein VE575_16885 [Acidimicrobiales bacterium]|jgi:hypothetical protein|nr:hypothetical protein [Acidimicrobiales bacterium]